MSILGAKSLLTFLLSGIAVTRYMHILGISILITKVFSHKLPSECVFPELHEAIPSLHTDSSLFLPLEGSYLSGATGKL